MREIVFPAMGTQVLVAVDSDDLIVNDELQRVPGWFEEWEQILSRFRPDSELSLLNRSLKRPVQVSEILWEVMQASMDIYQSSEGLVSPGLLPALEEAGYTESFQTMAKIQPQNQLLSSINTDFSGVQFFPKTRTVILPSGLHLDFGGVAKGWAVQQTMRRLEFLGAVLVDAGGDIAVSIPAGSQEGWQIGVKDPFDESKSIETLYLRQGGVATSGQDRRRWLRGGRWQHHIIDPRTRAPAETDFITVTVIAENVMEAEMAAKTVFILGSEQGYAWLSQRKDMEGLGILQDGAMVRSPGFERFRKA